MHNNNHSTKQENLPLLAVDLDGTLIQTDMVFETFWSACSRQKTAPLYAALSLLEGRSAMKTRLRNMAEINPASLPYNQNVISYIQQWRKSGGQTALVTASNHSVARKISEHLNIFDQVHGTSDLGPNLKGRNKADFLQQLAGKKGFNYIGDANADIHVWKKARLAITVNASSILKNKIQKICPNTLHIGKPLFSLTILAKTLRVHQWMKNILLFLPMILAHQFDAETILRSAQGFIAFSLTASALYLINDLLDLNADRSHPQKCQRPIASGNFSIIHATCLIPILLAAGTAASLLTNSYHFCLIMLTYAVCSCAYSLSWKQIPILDICLLASFYTLRILAGASVTQITVSPWLNLFSIFIFLSLGTTKRLTELANETNPLKRRDYQPKDLPLLCSMALASGYISVLVMALYISSPNVHLLYSSPHMLWGICPILMFWISRTIMLAHRGKMAEDVILFAIRDKTSLACAIITAGFAVAASFL